MFWSILKMGIIEKIKNEAENNGTKLQSAEEYKIEQEVNKLFYLDKNIEKELEFLKSVMTRGQGTQERTGVHASDVLKPESDFCLRKQILSLWYHPNSIPQNPMSKRVFAAGDAIHEKYQRLFIRGGLCNPSDCDVTLKSTWYHGLSFSPDISNAKIAGNEYVVEIKSMNSYLFDRMTEHESAKLQLMLYMHLLIKKRGFVLCENKDTQKIKIFVYKYDRNIIKPYLERIKKINEYNQLFLDTNKIPKRLSVCQTCKSVKAKMCTMRDTCFGISVKCLLDC